LLINTWCHFISDRPVMSNTFLGVPSIFTTVSRLWFREISLKSKSSNLRRHITDRTTYFNGNISASIRGILLKIQHCQYSHIAKNMPQFICHR
jgi:hypothetical protein